MSQQFEGVPPGPGGGAAALGLGLAVRVGVDGHLDDADDLCFASLAAMAWGSWSLVQLLRHRRAPHGRHAPPNKRL